MERIQKQEEQVNGKRTPQFEIGTDLAVGEEESFPGDGGEMSDMALREWRHASSQIKLIEVKILDDHSAKTMGKPKGTYVTLEANQMAKEDGGYHEEAPEELASQLKCLVKDLQQEGPLQKKGCLDILAVGFGNVLVTPDALGPKVLGDLQTMRHLVSQYGEGFCRKHHSPILSGIMPGVMAQTDMETAEIMMGIIHETKPDLVIATDALAARSVRRLRTTIQLSDIGIHPGSGVGSHRHSLAYENLGVPVIAISTPTVVGATVIVHDAVSTLIQTLASRMETKGMGDFLKQMNSDEQYQLISELLEPKFDPLYVTPPDIDQTVKQLGFTISEGTHQTFFG